MRLGRTICVLSSLLVASAAPGDAKPAAIYAEDFEKAAEGKPQGLLILNGAFEVKKVEGNGLLELAADPLDSNGAMVGPAGIVSGTFSARIQASSTGKRFPEFGLGMMRSGAYKLWVMPAVSQLQIIKGNDVVAQVAYGWSSGSWTRLKLRVAPPAGGKVRIEGKAWADGKEEPGRWMVSYEDASPPQGDRASIWATPYSGTPTRFDDLVIVP